MESLRNKVALVTGASKGIGKATAILLAKHGVKVMVADIDQDLGHLTVGEINDSGGYARFHHLNVANKEEIQKVCLSIFTEEGSLDLAVNNAGIGGTMKPTHEITSDRWEIMMAVNLSGVFYCMQEELKHMLAKGGGRIVNVSSLAGLNGVGGGASYSAAKHGMLGLTKSAAIEYAPYNVRVNAVCPGFIKTSLLDELPDEILDYSTNVRVPMKRIGSPEEVAQVIAWLLSDASSYVNGDRILIDGGFKAG